jgi:hypothetical protein
VSPERLLLSVDGFELEVPISASHPLETTDDGVRRAVIVIHGSLRNSEEQHGELQDIADRIPGRSEETVILAPQFLLEQDVRKWKLAPEVLFWGEAWRRGDASRDTKRHPRPAQVSSYGIIDAIVE